MEQKYYHSHGNGNIGMKQIKRNNEYLHRSVFKLYLHSVLIDFSSMLLRYLSILSKLFLFIFWK